MPATWASRWARSAVDAEAIAARRDQVVTRLVKGLGSLVKKNGVEYVRGRGRLEGPQQVRVAAARRGGRCGRRDRAARPRRHPGHRLARQVAARASCPTGRRIVTSDDVLRSASGADARSSSWARGAVGVEFASYYHDMGCEVTLLEYLPAIVPLEDAEVSKEMERAFTRRGIKVMTSARFDPASVRGR